MVRSQLRVLAAVLMGSLVLIFGALWLVLGDEDAATSRPSTPTLVGVLLLGLLMAALLELIGYRLPPLDPTTPPEEATAAAVARFRQGMTLRFAVAESVAMLSIAAGFVVGSGGLVIAGLGCAVSFVLLAVHVWPWRRPVDKTATALERDGARSQLRESFGLGAGGVVREL